MAPDAGEAVHGNWLRFLNTTRDIPHKSLMMVPERVALALMDDGWYLRSKIIWDKGFARPDSAKDRPTVTHGNILMFTKSRRYTYFSDPLRVPSGTIKALSPLPNTPRTRKKGIIRNDVDDLRVWPNPLGRNIGTVWRCSVANYPGSHPAAFPAELVRPMILATCSEPNDIVLDPFGGSGTAALVALQLGFHAITIDLHKQYTDEARKRIAGAPQYLYDDGEVELAAD
jgi:DNA modification methylase